MMKLGKVLILVVVLVAAFLLWELSLWKLQPAGGVEAADNHTHDAAPKGKADHQHGESGAARKQGAGAGSKEAADVPPLVEGDHSGHAHGSSAAKQGHEGEAPDEDVVKLSAEDIQKFGIEVKAAGSGRLGTQLSLPGEVAADADRVAHIVPKLSGTVREVRKNVGDTVKQGEIMAVIESRELADAKAEYLAAGEKVSLRQAKFEREQRLWQKKISAEQEYLDAKQELAEARIALRSAEQKLHALGFSDQYLQGLSKHHDESYTRYEVIAPFSGTVVEKHITLGEMLKEDADAFLIADLSRVWVNLNVYQKDISQIRKGQKVLISASHGIPDAEGTISYVAPIVKEETRTILARIILPNPEGHWRPGMFVTAKVGVEDLAIPLAVPKAALQTVEGRTVVFVETDEGFAARPVTIGRANESDVEILSGLSQGERYVSKGTFTLKAQLSKGAFGDGHAH